MMFRGSPRPAVRNAVSTRGSSHWNRTTTCGTCRCHRRTRLLQARKRNRHAPRPRARTPSRSLPGARTYLAKRASACDASARPERRTRGDRPRRGARRSRRRLALPSQARRRRELDRSCPMVVELTRRLRPRPPARRDRESEQDEAAGERTTRDGARIAHTPWVNHRETKRQLAPRQLRQLKEAPRPLSPRARRTR